MVSLRLNFVIMVGVPNVKGKGKQWPYSFHRHVHFVKEQRSVHIAEEHINVICVEEQVGLRVMLAMVLDLKCIVGNKK
jgi:hypothetical protein